MAQAIGAVNTIVKVGAKHASPSLIGHNTDAAGLLADLYVHDVHISHRPVLILGAGGAARAAVAACAGRMRARTCASSPAAASRPNL